MKLKRILSAILMLSPFHCFADHRPKARDWILSVSERSASWQFLGTLDLPSGSIFIGDPSRGGDYHLRGIKEVNAARLSVWLLIADDSKQVHTVWLEADGDLPEKISGEIVFGIDSAYFAFGDLWSGQDLANIGDLNLPKLPDSFEFFLPHIQNPGFTGIWLDAPPRNSPVCAVETDRDGGLKAVWTEGGGGRFSGILIDITGRRSDELYLDKLIVMDA